MIAFVFLIAIGSEIVILFYCRPLSYYWNKTTPGGYCWDLEIFYFINAGLNIVADVVITVLPFPVLARLYRELPKRQKVGLCGIFSLGGLVCAISVVRVVQLPALNHIKDITWDITNAMLWYYVESTFIVIAACGPALKPFFRLYLPAILGSREGAYKDSPSFGIAESHNMQRFQRSTNVTTGPRTKYGEGDSEEHIIGESSGIVKTTDVVLTVEDVPEPQSGGNGRRGSATT
ncbi:hypothetical protein L873DRAFT_1785635 [Choiromyces venosus 120613-1]|uniref:Rhodopsin domain-containing protein n=1 Tax=Choiromyces venosus 120613-1 TaxID=1336337 RepID=A0A3N4KAJ1_9PEZI|nr:hypothetical protein L873DRAFT_1785635 [Choiromyces venosus 120613-1]